MKKLAILFLLLPLLQSCTEVIDFDLNDEQSRIVIEGVITNENKEHGVRITRSTSYYFDETPPAVSGAVVTISSAGELFECRESFEDPGLYLTDSIQGVVGQVYSLTVAVDGEVYNASDSLKRIAPIDSSLAFPIIDTLFSLDTNYVILMFAQESPGAGDFYEWNYYINDSLWSVQLRDKNYASDDFVDGSRPPDGWPVFDGIPYDKVNVGDKITLEMLSIGEDYFNYSFELLLQTDFRGGFFDGPPANIRTNISNGALGFFRASAVERNTTYALPLIP